MVWACQLWLQDSFDSIKSEDIVNQVERPCKANSRQRYKKSANERIKNSSRFVARNTQLVWRWCIQSTTITDVSIRRDQFMMWLPQYICLYVYKYCCCLLLSSGYLFSLCFPHRRLFDIFISITPKGILLSFIYFQVLCNNLVSDTIFLVLFTLLHTWQSKQRLHFILKTENPIHCQAASPLPEIKI